MYFVDRMPFDWKTPCGYIITCLVQFQAWFFLLANCSVVLVFLGGVCWIIMAFIDDIKNDFHRLNGIKRPVDLKFKVNSINKFHSSVIQLSVISIILFMLEITCYVQFFTRFVHDFSDIYEIIIIGYYLWSITTICSTLLVIRIETVFNHFSNLYSCNFKCS